MATEFILFAFLVMLISSSMVVAGAAATRRLGRLAFGGVTIAVLVGYALVLWRQPRGLLVGNLVLLAGAVFAGGLLSWLIVDERALAIYLVCGAVIDTLSVFGGPTARLVDGFITHKSQLLLYLCVSVPCHGIALPVVGGSDLLVISVIAHTLAKCGHSAMARFLLPAADLALALGVALAAGFIAAIPSLAVVTIVYLLMCRRWDHRAV